MSSIVGGCTPVRLRTRVVLTNASSIARCWNDKVRFIASTTTKIPTPHGNLAIREQFTSPPGGATVDTTGRYVWPTALPLLNRILEMDEGYSTVLELGAGCGVVGMGLAASGRFRVALTDQSSCVDWLQKNVDYNRDLMGDRVEVHPLDWSSENDLVALEARLPALDWIVGSDILYNPATHAALVTTLRRLAVPNHTTILLAFPRRQDNEQAFVSLLQPGECFDVKIEPMLLDEIASSSSTTTATKEYSLARLSLK